MFDRRILGQVDWGLLLAIFLIAGTGVTMIYSATYSKTGGLERLYLYQIAWVGVGLLGVLVLMIWDYQIIYRHAYLIYAVVVLLLILIFPLGKTIGGATRWLVFGPIRLQPSEFAKLAVIIALARHLSNENQTGLLALRDLGIPALLILIPAALIARQPDMGTALVLAFIGVIVLFTAGLRFWTIVILSVGAVAMTPLGWFFLKGYQRERILTVLQGGDPLDAGYHSLQAKIAIGSGGLTGKGLLAGTQSQLHFLPAQHTDFILAVLAEEVGFLGSMWLLVLFSILVIQGIRIGYRSRDLFGSLLAAGVAGSLSLHIVLNVAMTTGMLPVVGLPLPLMSYGGSSMVATLLGIGLLLNIRMRRFSF